VDPRNFLFIFTHFIGKKLAEMFDYVQLPPRILLGAPPPMKLARIGPLGEMKKNYANQSEMCKIELPIFTFSKKFKVNVVNHFAF
jgi:hypothetical protein